MELGVDTHFHQLQDGASTRGWVQVGSWRPVEKGLVVNIDVGTLDVGAGAVAPLPLQVVGDDKVEDVVVSGETIQEVEPHEVEEAEVAEGGLHIVVIGLALERGWGLVDVQLGGGNLLGPTAGTEHGDVADML